MADVDLRRLASFVVLARERHFGRAATALGIAQPSLSQQMARLEDEVGVRLIDRASRPVRLTPAGLALAEGAAPGLLALDDAVATARRTAGGNRTLRVALPRTEYARHPALADLLVRVRAALPDHRIALRPLLTVEALAALRAGEVDAAIVYSAVDMDDIEVRPLFHDEPVVIMPPGHRLADSDGVALSDLAGETLVCWSRDVMPSVRDDVEAGCRRAGFEPRLAEAPPEPGALGGMVADGVGVALVSRAWAEGWRGDDIVVRPLVRPRIVMSAVLVWLRTTRNAAVATLAEAAGGPFPAGRA